MQKVQESADNRVKGILLRLACATCLASMAAVLKLASNDGANLVELVFWRNIAALPLISAWVLFTGWRTAIKVNRPMAHVTRATLGITSMTCNFATIALLPLAQATTLTYAAPIVATVLSTFMLREHVGIRRWSAVMVGFVGVVLVAQPHGDAPMLGIFVGLCSAFIQALSMVTLRQISKSEGPTSIAFWFTLMSTILVSCVVPFYWKPHAAIDYAYMIAAGLFGGAGQLTMTGSLRYAPVSVVTPFDYIQIIWAMAFGWFFMASVPGVLILIGAALITASGIYTAYRESRRGILPAQALQMPEA